MLRVSTCVALFVVAATPLSAQTAGLRSTTRALALVDSAIAAYGGAERLRAIEDVTIKFRGRRWMAYQSETLKQPWTTQRTVTDIVLDFKNNRMRRHGESRYPADFVFAGTTITTPQATYAFDPTRAGTGDVMQRFPGAPIANSPARRELPAFQTMILRDRVETLRWLGEKTENGQRMQGVSYAEPNGAVYDVWFDNGTKYLVKLEWVRDDLVEGDQLASYTYSGYRTERGIPVPSRLLEHRNGDLTRDDTLHVAIDTRPADSLFTPPSGYQPPPTENPPAEPVRKLAENVWLLQQLPGGNRALFVAFRDYVLVFETPSPQAAATAALDAIRRTVPGKPVRYAVFSHHHDDHAAGLRPYVMNGITIVTTPTNKPFVERVAAAKHTLRPDALSAAPRAPVIETFTKKRVFTDGDMTVELHDIGPTSHIDEIVMAYFPREKLIFQGDLLILNDHGVPAPANKLTQEFARAIDRLGLDVQTIAGVHGRVGTIGDLRTAVSKVP
jgi:glyoxylase-like metal-dependent hydrolase (beta-lactamase superfamily II)